MSEMKEKLITCPKCNSKNLILKDVATYEYSYRINPDGKIAWTDEEGAYVPYIFYDREQTAFNQYISCGDCGAKYPSNISRDQKGIDFVILQKAIRSDNNETPEFYG